MEDGRDKIQNPRSRVWPPLPLNSLPDSSLSISTLPSHKSPVGSKSQPTGNVDLFTPYLLELDILLHLSSCTAPLPFQAYVPAHQRMQMQTKIHDQPATWDATSPVYWRSWNLVSIKIRISDFFSWVEENRQLGKKTAQLLSEWVQKKKNRPRLLWCSSKLYERGREGGSTIPAGLEHGPIFCFSGIGYPCGDMESVWDDTKLSPILKPLDY